MVVIAIISILIALLLPAVNAAREAARNAQCKNNLRQIGLGFLSHEATHGFYPSGGWSAKGVGDADRGFGREQPGGWAYAILPFIEEQALFDLPSDGQKKRVTSQQRELAVQLQRSSVKIYNCPSRRAPIPYPYRLGSNWKPFNSNQPDEVVRGDYGANSGDTTEGMHYFATDWEVQSDGTREYTDYEFFFWPSNNYAADSPHWRWPPESGQSGISCYGSEIRMVEVKDGASNTYMVGEKYLNTDFYTNGRGPNDNHSVFQGADWDVNCWGNMDPNYAPKPDTPGYDLFGQYGSAHPGAFNVVMCDGSVQAITYDVNLRIHTFRSNRADGQVIGDGAF